MAINPIPTPLPADLPENWQTGQTVAPKGSDVGLPEQYGYNYQSKQINDAQKAVNAIGAQFPNLYGKGDTVQVSDGGTGGTTITEALANLGAQPGFNLLVNSRFKYNGRNQNSYPQDSYTVDGWEYVSNAASPSGNANVVENGIQILPTCGVKQTIQNPPDGKEVTLSAEINGNIISGSFVWNQNSGFVEIYSQNGWRLAYVGDSNYISIGNLSGSYTDTLSAAKLELGSVSTLAADLAQGQDEAVEQLRLDLYDLDAGRPAWVLTQNENLLDNAYFVGGGSQQGGGQFPINQRGKTSYSYSSNGAYSIDRWVFSDANSSVTLNSDNITLFNSNTATGNAIALSQIIESSRLEKNAPYVFSVLVDEISQGSWYISTDMGVPINAAVTQPGLVSLQFIFTAQKDNIRSYIWKVSTNSNDNIKIKAVKLELGTRSTLARLVDGKWVLNDPPPNFQQELAKCQRMYQIYSSATERPSNGYDCRPVMRLAAPSQGTILINDQTWYYNDANL